MRRPALVALALLAAPPTVFAEREPAAEVAAALRAARTPSATARADGGVRRLYVLLDTLDDERRAALEAAGLTIELPTPGAPALRWRDGVVVQGRASPVAGRRIAALPFVRSLEVPGEAWANAGSVTTAGDAILATDATRVVAGTDGAGVTIGVISDGADARTLSIASGDLPGDLAIPPLPGVGAGGGNEGTALLEIVHDVAPGARLLFAGPRTSVEMVAAIGGLAAAGARVIVDDLVFTDEPKFEDGPIAAAAARFVAAGGVYVTAAGNFARRHYLAPYRAGASRTLAGTVYRTVHDFGAGDFGNTLRVAPGTEVIVVLQWNEPFGAAADDLDLVLGREGGEALAASTGVQGGGGVPLEAVRWRNDGGTTARVYVAVAEYARSAPGVARLLNLHVFARGDVTLERATARESVFGHAALREVLSVAAAPAGEPDTIQPYSSRGPATVYFPSRDVRPAPRLAAVDGVETAVGRRGLFANPFYGTSAAAPHVAGCAALLLAAGVSGEATRETLVATATDLGRRGVDRTSGGGRLDCAAAARLALGLRGPAAVTEIGARFDPTAALVVAARGTDPDADARSALVRLLGAGDEELARTTVPVTGGATTFTLTVALRRPVLARARAVAARVTDATGLAGPERRAAIACPGDETIGDTFCIAGTLATDLAALPGTAARRLGRRARGIAADLARAGAASARRRPAAVRRALAAAARGLARVARAVPRSGAPPELVEPIAVAAQALAARVRALRGVFTGASRPRNARMLSSSPHDRTVGADSAGGEG